MPPLTRPGTCPGIASGHGRGTGAFLDVRIEAIVAAAREDGSASGEVRLRSDGPVLLVRARRSPVRGLWLVLEDVSELRRLQQIRAEFIDNLSHELRTPLTTISLLAETLTREADAAGAADAGQDARPDLEDRGGDRPPRPDGQRIARSLADRERRGDRSCSTTIDMGRGRDSRSAERLRLFADRQGVTMESDVPTSVPPIRGDDARLGQVLVNLLHNAVKFSPDGGAVTVRVRADGPAMSSHRSSTRGSASPRPPRRASSNGSTRWIGRESVGRSVGPASAWRSPGMWSSSTTDRIWVESSRGGRVDVLLRDARSPPTTP